jgi:hypothetical protein
MAEFVVAAPVMILLWLGVSYFRQGYARRLQTMSDSHAQAWAKAYSNSGECFTVGAGPWKGWTEGKQQGGGLSDGSGGDPGVEAKFAGTSSMFIYGTVREKATRTTKGAYWNGSVSSETFLTCDELVPATKPGAGGGTVNTGNDPNADQNVVAPLWDFAKSFFRF